MTVLEMSHMGTFPITSGDDYKQLRDKYNDDAGLYTIIHPQSGVVVVYKITTRLLYIDHIGDHTIEGDDRKSR